MIVLGILVASLRIEHAPSCKIVVRVPLLFASSAPRSRRAYRYAAATNLIPSYRAAYAA